VPHFRNPLQDSAILLGSLAHFLTLCPVSDTMRVFWLSQNATATVTVCRDPIAILGPSDTPAGGDVLPGVGVLVEKRFAG
jgi:hypothetical protein